MLNPYPAGTKSGLNLCHWYRAWPVCKTLKEHTKSDGVLGM